MPSLQHESLLLLFRNRPELAPELLRDVLHVEVPAYSEARVESAELTDVNPAEYRADLVVLLVDGKPVLGIVVEVQLGEDPRKRFTWPVYVAGLRARLKCPACVLVVTPTEAMARWCRRADRYRPGQHVPAARHRPVRRSPSSTTWRRPSVTRSSRSSQLIAHGHEARAEVLGRAALLGMLRLSDERQVLYSDLVFAALSEAARAALEDLMASGNYEFQSDFAKKHQAKGRAEGEVKGEAKGRAEGRAEALLAVLEARGLRASDEARARILACTDVAQLDAWIRKAISVSSVNELF